MKLSYRSAIVVLLAVVSCEDAESPWARKMSRAERLAWPTTCGISADRVSASDGRAGYAYTVYQGQSRGSPLGDVACDLLWDRDRDQLRHLEISVSRDEPALTAADIEPLLTLALAELRPGDHAVARDLAVGEFRKGSTGGVWIRGGFRGNHRHWGLSISAR
jgi:hypothetical protein